MSASFGRLGETIDSLSRSEFVQWFQLEPTGEAPSPGAVTYRPSGPAFRALVALDVAAASGTLERLELQVARGFIDDPRQGMFARDIIKSFVEAVAPTPATAALAQEVLFRDPPGPVLMRGSAPALDEAPSPAFRAIAGAAERAAMRENGLAIAFVNAREPEPRLTITVAPA